MNEPLDQSSNELVAALPLTSPPLPAPPLTLSYASAGIVPYMSAGPRAAVLVRWIWVTLVGQVCLLWPAVVELLNRIAWARDGDAYKPILAGIPIGEVLEGLVGIAAIVVVVYWLMWVHRTYRNLPALGVDGLRFTPAWAVWYYFIPIVHLYRPYQVMHETWQASDPDHEGGESWKALPKAPIVSAWWVMRLLLLAGVAAYIALELQGEDKPRALVAASVLNVLTALLAALIIFVELRIVVRLTELQEMRAGRVGTISSNAMR